MQKQPLITVIFMFLLIQSSFEDTLTKIKLIKKLIKAKLFVKKSFGGLIKVLIPFPIPIPLPIPK